MPDEDDTPTIGPEDDDNVMSALVFSWSSLNDADRPF